MDEETKKKVDVEIANIIAMSGKLTAEAGKLSAETAKVNADIIAMSGKLTAEAGKLSAETAKVNAETMKINSENKYYPIIVTATATLAIVGLARLFFDS